MIIIKENKNMNEGNSSPVTAEFFKNYEVKTAMECAKKIIRGDKKNS